MKRKPIGKLVALVLWSYAILLTYACSHENTIGNIKPTQQTKHTDTKAINPSTASKLVTSKEVSSVAAHSFIWLSEGQSIALASSDELNLFNIYSRKTSQPVALIQVKNPTLLSVSHATNKIAWISEDNLLHIWDIEKQIALPAIGKGTSPVTGLSFARENPVIAVAGYDKSISIWDVSSQKEIFTWNTSTWLTELSFSPDSRQIAGVDLEGFSLHLFEISTGEGIEEIRWSDSASAVLYNALLSPDWNKVAWVSRGIVQIMDISDNTIGPLLSHEDYVSDVAWAPNSLVIATAAGATVNGQFSPVVKLWDIQTGELLNTLVQKSGVIGLDFSPDGHDLAILLSGGVLQIWTIE